MAKVIKSGVLYRAFDLDRASIDQEKRTVRVSFSSEAPVERSFGIEILDHQSTSVRMDRIRKAGPALFNHDRDAHIGRVISAEIVGGRGEAVIQFSNSALGSEKFRDVQDGILTATSVGYRVWKMEETKNAGSDNSYRCTDWEPMEISLVTVPADVSVGYNRGDEAENEIQIGNIMSEAIVPTPAPAPTPGLEVMRETVRKEELTRSNEINAFVDKLKVNIPGLQDIGKRAISEGWSVDQFRAAAMNSMPTVAPIDATPKNPLADVSARDWNKYSLVRAINGLSPGGKLDGLEKELSDEMSLKGGKRCSGVWVPPQALEQRNLVAGTGTLGGFAVSTPNMGDMFIDLLRNRAKVIALGAQTLSLSNPITIPRQSGAGATNWVGESVASTLSVGNFTQITLTPNAVSAFQQYSKLLLNESNPSIDALVRNDIMAGIALAIDLAALHGTGSGQPTGIAATSGIGTVALAANGQALANATAYPFLVSLETVIGAANADVANMGYLMRSAHRGSLKVSPRFASTDTPVWEPNNTVNGYRAEVSNQIATNLTTGTATTICSAIFLGNWSDLIIADFFGGVDLTVDPYSAGANGVVKLYARKWVDVAVRHPASFAIGGGIL